MLGSTQKLYERGVEGFTVPAFNIRTLVFDTAQALFRAALKEKAGAFIIEIAESELEYTGQTLEEYKEVILKAGQGFDYPIFLQGDHFSFNRELINKAIGLGFYNIDIDCSEFKDNVIKTAQATKFIRQLNSNVSIGGEVGVIGGKNTTLKEFKDFMEEYNKEIGNIKGIIKIAIQTGTSHGGIISPLGKIKIPNQDFKTLEEISKEAKKYGLAGAVQHGASTLPNEYFSKFPKTGCCEIHLATIFQNIVYDSQYFPKDLRQEIYSWLKNNYDMKGSEAQFIYKNRKYALAKFKQEINNIPQKDKICEELEEKFRFFFRELNVSNTFDLIKKIYH